VSIPVIASGGAGSAAHVADALRITDAALIASIVHENPAGLRVCVARSKIWVFNFDR